MVTDEQLLDFVGGTQSDLEFVGKCLVQAIMLVNAYCVRTPLIPQDILDNAYLQVGSELFHRRNAPSRHRSVFIVRRHLTRACSKRPYDECLPTPKQMGGKGRCLTF